MVGGEEVKLDWLPGKSSGRREMGREGKRGVNEMREVAERMGRVVRRGDVEWLA